MKYQTYLKKIMEQLSEYKRTVDTLATSYLEERTKHEKELEDMRGKYTDSFITESKRNWKPKMDYGKAISEAREKHLGTATEYLDRIKAEMDGYFQIPVNPSFSATVTALKTVGAKISDREFQMLQETSGGYWDRKLLSELANNRTEKTDKVKLNDKNEPERTTVDKPIPYIGVTLPSIEAAYDSLQGVKNSINTAFNSYCGMDFELKDIVFPLDKEVQTNAKIAETYGLQPQPSKHDNMTLSKMGVSLKCFDESHRSYTAFSEMMGKLEQTMPKPKRKTVLTDNDKKLIDCMLDPRYPSLGQNQAVEIAKLNSDLAQILLLDKRYSKSVKEALEVGENE